MYDIMYICDPRLNKPCSKKHCFMNDGPCVSTRQLKYAKQPVTTVKMMVNADDFADMIEEETDGED